MSKTLRTGFIHLALFFALSCAASESGPPLAGAGGSLPGTSGGSGSSPSPATGGTSPATGGTTAAGGGAGTTAGAAGSAGTAGSGNVAGSGGSAGSGDGHGWSGVDHPPQPITECQCAGTLQSGSDAQRCVRVVNRCDAAIRFRAAGNDTPDGTLDGVSVDLAPGECDSYVLTEFGSGRLWGESGCGDGQCDPGPHTLAEFTLSGWQGLDYYDLSLVDGYNLPMSIQPVAGTFTPGSGKYDCGTPICMYDLLEHCPAELIRQNEAGQTAVCLSACSQWGDAQYCCAGAHATPDTCPPSEWSEIFKAACPDAYSYAYDDQASTYVCGGTDALKPDYDIVFCP